MPDGTLNPPQVKVLTEMGDFLTPNGEAIFNTRPWKIHAEGDDAKLNVQKGKHPVWKFHNCDATDIRFTRSKDLKSLYVITLGYPEGGKLLVKSLGEKIRISSKGVQSVSSVKTGKPVEWKRSAAGMEIKLPAELGREEIAYAFKVEVKGSLDMDAPRLIDHCGAPILSEALVAL